MNDLIEEIKLAYKLHGLRPIRGFFFIRRKNHVFACPLVALAVHRGVMDGVDPGFEFVGGAIDAGAIVTVEWAVETFGQRWLKGFLDGFDGQAVSGNDQEYQEGHGLGLSLAQEILPASS